MPPTTTAVHRPVASPRPKLTAKRIAGVSVGGVLAVVGVTVALGGGGVLAAFGTDGTLSSGTQSLSTPAAAVVSPVASIRHTTDITSRVGQPVLRAASTSTQAGKAVFVGIGPKAAVDRYLAKASVDQITDLDVEPWSVSRHVSVGSAAPAAPGTQSFWVARSSGTSAAVDWKVRDGDHRVVVMNADGTPGVGANGEVSITMAHMTPIAIGALIIGLLLAGAGVAVMARAVRAPASEGPIGRLQRL